MDDDGRIEARTRLVRPMTRETISVDQFGHSHWRKATADEFGPLWEAECAHVPEFSESAFHVITGLLLPIWDRLPAENMRVYRFETEAGERVIGRLVTPEALDVSISNGRRSGHYWISRRRHEYTGPQPLCAPLRPESGPGAAGKWTDAATGEHGDLLDLIHRNRDLHRLVEAMDEARAFLALPVRRSRRPLMRAKRPRGKRIARGGTPDV